MTERPPAIDLIARRRAEGVPERKIAEELGMTPRRMWKKVSEWNVANPDDRLPRPLSRRKDVLYADIVRLAKAGCNGHEIARRLDMPRGTVRDRLIGARKAGLLPPKPPAQGRTAWDTLRAKGAAPPMGSIGAIVDALSAAEIDAMLRHSDRNDKTLADTLARIVKEYLDGYTDPRR